MSILSESFKHATEAIAIGILLFVPFAGAAEASGQLSKKQLKALVAGAKSPEDHLKLAAYYRAETARLTAKQREHEEEAAEYYKDPSQHPTPKYPTLGQHCRDLAYYYGKGAQSAQALAASHEAMAAAAPGGDAVTSGVASDKGTASATPAAPATGAKDCMGMMAERQAVIRAMDDELQRKLIAMNEASSDTKLDAMAAVINELVSQHRAMRKELMSSQSGMAADFGALDTHHESAGQCLMMKATAGPR